MPSYQEKPKHAPHGYHHPDQYWVCGYVDFAQRFRHHSTTPVQAVFVQQRSCGITLLGLASAIQVVAPQYGSSVRWSATSAVNPGILISATAFQGVSSSQTRQGSEKRQFCLLLAALSAGELARLA